MPDDRAILAEYGDLLRLRPDHRDKEQTKQLPFDQLSLPDGPVLDIGAGTGLGTVALATALPDREVWAVEPDPTSRAVLHARVADAGLMEQVTVFASDLESAD
ncbi:MAG: methyltransferase domain-containing protein, partial [Nocardioidaceae bacterium]